MQLVVVGAHQRTAPMSIREQLAFSPEALQAALKQLLERFNEAFIISTCNRVELYVVGTKPDAGRPLRQFLADFHAISLEDIAPYLYTLSGEDAVRHIFRVAAGLDSMALGEDQIMGQIKSAIEQAQAVNGLGTLLHRLTNMALSTGKLVRTNTNLSRSQLSVVSVALQLGRESLGDFTGKRITILGSGRTAELALKHLKKDAAEVTVMGRTRSRVADLAERYQVQAAHLSELDMQLGQTDLVIGCTSSPEPLISREQLAGLRSATSDPLVILDLAVPRDVEREVSGLPGVTLKDVDDMQAICESNRAARAAEVSQAETIADEQVQKCMQWWATREVLPTIRALRDHAETIRQSEVDRAMNRLSLLSDDDQQAIQALTVAIINKLLHTPITSLKEPHASEELAQAAQQLFRLNT